MQRDAFNRLGRLLAFACAIEIATGLAMLLATAHVVRLLLGAEAVGVALALGRVFGIAIIGLGWAVWPSHRKPSTAGTTWRAMVAYNAMIATYLGWLGFAHTGGMLLWPAVILHAAMVVLLILAARHEDSRS